MCLTLPFCHGAIVVVIVWLLNCRIYHYAQVCLGTGPRWPGGHLPAKQIVYDGLRLMWRNFKFEGVLILSDSRHEHACLTVRVGRTGPSKGPHNLTSTGPHLF